MVTLQRHPLNRALLCRSECASFVHAGPVIELVGVLLTDVSDVIGKDYRSKEDAGATERRNAPLLHT
jgi:hypothetical protein